MIDWLIDLALLQVLSALRLKRLEAFISSLYQGTAGLTFIVLVLSRAWQSITLESVVLYLRVAMAEEISNINNFSILKKLKTCAIVITYFLGKILLLS